MKETMGPFSAAQTNAGGSGAPTPFDGGATPGSPAQEPTGDLPPGSSHPQQAQQQPTVADEDVLPRAFGKYTLLEKLGEGGMGVVYKAEDGGIGRVVALKMVKTRSALAPSAVERFRREAQAAGRFDHSSIVPLYEFGEQDGRHFYTMPYIDGLNLKQWVRQQGTPPQAEALRIVAALAEAVAHAHEKGIVHRDLKPANVMVDQERRPRILDFGLARTLSDEAGLTSSGVPVGTPEYMAPEQANGDLDRIGPPADIYALGGILYYLLTGAPPFTASSYVKLLVKVQDPATPVVRPSVLQPDVSPPVEEACLCCLNKDPEQRYASAAQLAAVLQALRPASLSVIALPPVVPPPAPAVPPSPPAPPPVRTPPKKPFPVVLAVVAALLLVAVVVTGVWLWGLRPQAEPGAASSPAPPVSTEADPIDPAPQALRADFRLAVELTSADGKVVTPDARQVYPLRAGQQVMLAVTPARDCHLLVLNVDEGGAVTQLFPANTDDARRLFKAGARAVLFNEADGDNRYLDAEPAKRPEHLYVAASGKAAFPVRGGGRAALPKAEADDVFRPIVAKVRAARPEDGRQFSETTVRYWVR